jgi:hypothetical protein
MQIEHVSGAAQVGQRNGQCGEVERHEEGKLMGSWPLATVAERSKPVAEPRHARPQRPPR